MGRVSKIYYSDIINSVPDRHANKLQVEESNDGEYHIHFRNLKITLTKEQMREWKNGFAIALSQLGDNFKNDI